MSPIRPTQATLALAPRPETDPRFTLHGRHIAKLDRFVWQAQRAALRAEREFEGVSLELDDRGTVSVHAMGMTSILL